MTNFDIIDKFLDTFTTYIDSGFGLLSGDVAFLTSILIGIDITLAGLYWASGGDQTIIGRLVKKTLYVGFFALLINNFSHLSQIVFDSFAGLGLIAAGSGLTPEELLSPGRVALKGFNASWPLLGQVRMMIGFPEFFSHFIHIIILLLAWFLVILAFFVLAVQMFITILEFKLTTLAGFLLVPFGLWKGTSFLAERVLGHVVTSGIKVLYLAVIVGVGSQLFVEFTTALTGKITITIALAEVLGALTLLGLAIFGPGMASGLVSGAPQLGAGAAVGSVGAAVGGAMIAGGAVAGAARMAPGATLGAIKAASAMGSATKTSAQLGSLAAGGSGIAGVAGGISGVAKAAGGALAQSAKSALGNAATKTSAHATEGSQKGFDGAWKATGGKPSAAMNAQSGGSEGLVSSGGPPPWAKRLQAEQKMRARRQTTSQTIKDGDKQGASANPSLSDKDE